MELTVERKVQERRRDHRIGGGIAITPAIGEDYWAYRVRLSEAQAIVGFPKFFTVGIGFAQEEDWNTNLPYTCGTEEIYDHIAHNKGDDCNHPRGLRDGHPHGAGSHRGDDRN